MSNNRFAIIHSQTNITHVTTCPILYVSGRLLYDRRIKDSLIQLKFQNIVDGIINSVTISINGYDENNEKIIDSMIWEYDNLSIKRDSAFGSEVAIYLNNVNVKSYSIIIQKISYMHNDKSINWENNDNLSNYTIDIKSMKEELGNELKNQYNKENNCRYDDTICQEYDDLWICTCGAINQSDEQKCHKCGKDKNWVKSHCNKELLKQESIKLKKQEIQEANYLKEQKNLKRKAIIRQLSIILGISFCIVILLTQVIFPKYKNYRVEKFKKSFEKDIVDFFNKQVKPNMYVTLEDEEESQGEFYDEWTDRLYKEYKLGGVMGDMYFEYPAPDGEYYCSVDTIGWKITEMEYADVIEEVLRSYEYDTPINHSQEGNDPQNKSNKDLSWSEESHQFLSEDDSIRSLTLHIVNNSKDKYIEIYWSSDNRNEDDDYSDDDDDYNYDEYDDDDDDGNYFHINDADY